MKALQEKEAARITDAKLQEKAAIELVDGKDFSKKKEE